MRARHLEMSELLAVRDGDADRAQRAHVEDCGHCRAELERLRRIRSQLRSLPIREPGRDLWPEVAAGLGDRTARRRRIVGAITGLAVAAALTGVLVLRGTSTADRQAPNAIAGAEDVGVETVLPTERGSPDLGPMIARSRSLERVLQRYLPPQPVYDAPTALAVSVLEDRISLIDQALTQGRAQGVDRAVLRELLRDRVTTLETLVDLQVGQGPGRGEAVWR